MTSVPVTEANVLDAGFDVRTDANGVKWAVSPTAPEGDFSAAVKIVPEPAPGTIVPFTTVTGQCGSSWFTFVSKTKFRTGYSINANKGATFSRSWSVALSSSIDLRNVPMDSPLGTPQYWDETRTHDAQALGGTLLSGVAGGSVLTATGICTSGAPTATVRW